MLCSTKVVCLMPLFPVQIFGTNFSEEIMFLVWLIDQWGLHTVWPLVWFRLFGTRDISVIFSNMHMKQYFPWKLFLVLPFSLLCSISVSTATGTLLSSSQPCVHIYLRDLSICAVHYLKFKAQLSVPLQISIRFLHFRVARIPRKGKVVPLAITSLKFFLLSLCLSQQVISHKLFWASD